MDQVATFFSMGGYGPYIWPCFALSAVVLIALYLRSRQRLKAIERELAALEGRRGQRRARGMASPAEESLS